MSNKFQAPRKSLGQNFLQDANIIQKIVAAVSPRDTDQVIEIGPGRGALTEHLLSSNCQLTVIEFDRDLANFWLERAETEDKLTVHAADALKVDFDSLSQRNFKLVGNLPYNISSPLLLKMIDVGPRLQSVVVMLQKEVIDRISASPNTKQYGRLSVVLQQAFMIKSLFNVPPTAFFPPPKVTSAVAELVPHDTLPVADQGLLQAIVKLAFAQRRKTLRNNFKNSPYLSVIEQLGIDLGLRAENLTVAEYVDICNAIKDA
ncbi:MAG: 16S rRNA (adenine(1518)-N(6)/adenine(1519)-N(6))-dimethyltransferase RsmA [Pseudomonadota bacterium]